MSGRKIHLGFEVATGIPVEIPLRHMVVTGQSQEAGKTTTLEALISRAALPAVAFVTKRGERSFTEGARIPPYFRERADWQFVASVLEATMREKMRFERAWIMRASKGAMTLADVQANIKRLMEKAKGLSADMYMTLDAYLDIVVPRLQSLTFSESLELSPGLNVVDLADRDRFPPELQSLVMRSVIEWVYEHAEETVTIIPEAWEFVPQGRGSPVKLQAIELIRKGAGLHNYVWLDSQDIGGVDKQMLRSCPVWLLGVQRETNEIKRVLDNIPAGVAKPKAADVALLRKGEFFACHGRKVVKTYVQPAWMSEADALAIALGDYSVDKVTPPAPAVKEDEDVDISALESKIDKLTQVVDRLTGVIMDIPNPNQEITPSMPRGIDAPPQMGLMTDIDAIYSEVKRRLLEEKATLIKVLRITPAIEVTTNVETIETTDKTLQGRLALMIREGFFDDRTTGQAAYDDLRRNGFSTAKPTVYKACDQLTALGFLIKYHEKGNKGYEAVAAMKTNIKAA